MAILYRVLSGVATLIGGFALAISFRFFNPEIPFGLSELWSYVQSLAGALNYATLIAILVLFALYGAAVAIIGYIASPAILTIDEMASGCQGRPALPLGLNGPNHCRRRRAPAHSLARVGTCPLGRSLGAAEQAAVNAGCERCRRERRLGSRYFWHSSCCFYSPIYSQD